LGPTAARAETAGDCVERPVEVQLDRLDRFWLQDGAVIEGQLMEGTAGGFLVLTPDGELSFVAQPSLDRMVLDAGPPPALGSLAGCYERPAPPASATTPERPRPIPTAATPHVAPTQSADERAASDREERQAKQRRARQRRWEKERAWNPLRVGAELVGIWGVGLRWEYKPDRVMLESFGMRGGVTSSISEGWGLPFPLWTMTTVEQQHRAAYLAGTVDLLPFRTQIGVTGGWSYHFSYDGYAGVALGLALRQELPETITLQAGLLVLSDLCWHQPIYVLDFGPTFAW